jgi:hypothetical protein
MGIRAIFDFLTAMHMGKPCPFWQLSGFHMKSHMAVEILDMVDVCSMNR